MSQYKAIPQPGDQRNVSQNDILSNYQYLSTPLNPTAGVPAGILPVDHFASGDNVANPTDGFHKQASFQDRATPANLTNAINAQASSGILYSKTDGQPTSQLRYKNSVLDTPVTVFKAIVNYNGAGVILGNAFNVSSVTHVSTGVYRINFTVAMPNTNYLVISNPANSTARFINYSTKLVASVLVNSISILGVPSDVSEASTIILGLF